MSLSIGDPPMLFYLDIDTGSDLTWVECDAPCEGCSKVSFTLLHDNTDFFLVTAR